MGGEIKGLRQVNKGLSKVVNEVINVVEKFMDANTNQVLLHK